MLESRRLLTAGELDLTFGIGGKVLTDIGNGAHNSGSGVAAFQSDGKVIMNGYMSGVGDNNIDFGVVRYNSNGSLDTSFGVNGVVSVDFGGIRDLGFGIAVDSNDRIIVVVLVSGFSYGFKVARLTVDGELDSSFDSDGKQSINCSYAGAGIAVDSFDRAILVGTSYNGANNDFGVVRLTTNGELDSSFGTDGKQTVDFGNDDYGSGVAVDDLDRVLLAGYTEQVEAGIDDFAVARLTANGVLDLSFNIDGKQTIDFGSDFESGASVAVDSEGRVLVAGTSYQEATGQDFAIARFESDALLVRRSPSSSTAKL